MFSLNAFYSFGIYSVGIFLGFILTPFVVRKRLVSEQDGIQLDQDYDKLFLTYKFVDEVDEAPDSCLTEEQLEGLRDKVLHYEIPYIGQKVILFYDHKKGGFSYYANSGIIYKYLNVAARKYVLDYGCKQVFKEMVPSMKKEEKTVTFNQFVPKVGKTLLEKDMNLYHYLGTFQDFERKPTDHKKIDFAAYMRMLEAIVAEPVLEKESPGSPDSSPDSSPESDPTTNSLDSSVESVAETAESTENVPEPENKITKVLDFLRQFSSIPKSQSIKID